MAVIQTVREYELHELLGGGGMGEVYRARHVLLDQPYAIKVVLPALLQNAEIRARFLREAQTLQRLDHPNILRFVTLFEDSGRLFLVTELLAGHPLDVAVQNGADPARKAHFFHQTVRGVAHAHRRGVLHRDLKPGNLQVLPDDRLKILDFGIARPVAARALTATGHLVGTPVYLPPEIILGETASSAAGPTWDVYTLGLLAYELFTGRLPFDLDPNGPPLQLLNDLSRFYGKKIRAPELRTLAPALSKPWIEAIERALLVDSSRRLSDAGELLRLLDGAAPLSAMETQIVALSTENLAPEDATGIHVLAKMRRPPAAPSGGPPAVPSGGPGASPSGGPSPPANVGADALAGPPALPPITDPTQIVRLRDLEPRSPQGDDTQTVDRRQGRTGRPTWLVPAAVAFAAGLLFALLLSRGTSPTAPISAPSSDGVGTVAPSTTLLAGLPATGPALVSTAPTVMPEDRAPDAGAADSGTLEFEPVSVGQRPRPRPALANREPPRPASVEPTGHGSGVVPAGGGSSVGVLSVSANPSALVYVDDRFIGETPIRGRLLKPGRYEVKLVRSEKPATYRQTLSALIRAGQRTELRYEPPPQPPPKRK